MRRSYLSLCERYLGFGPWWLVTGVAILAGFVLWRQFTLSGETDAALQASGLGPIYKLARNKDHWELLFGLGRRHGVREGEVLALLDQKRTRVGSVTALRVGEESSQARLGLDAMPPWLRILTGRVGVSRGFRTTGKRSAVCWLHRVRSISVAFICRLCLCLVSWGCC